MKDMQIYLKRTIYNDKCKQVRYRKMKVFQMKIETFNKQTSTQLNIVQLENAFNKTLENCEQLIDDSKILFHNGRFQRSFFLSSIAKEEIGKCAHIEFIIMIMYSGMQIDWKKFWKIFYTHKLKREYMLYIDHIIEFFVGQKVDIEKQNRIEEGQKLASLYTDYYNNDFQNPIDIIGEDDARLKLEYMERLYSAIASAVGKLVPTEEELKRRQEEIDKIDNIFKQFK